MRGRHEYQPELFSVLDYEKLIPRNHLLRRVEKVLDLSFLSGLTTKFYSANQGRPSIDPEIFIRIVLLGYLYDIDSDRRLCEELGYNLAYRWFCKLSLRDAIPDHSSLTRIRDRLGEATYKEIFRQVVEQCRKAGLVKGERILADGSLIYADASLYSMREREVPADSPAGGDSAGIRVAASKDGLSNNDLRRNSIVGKKLTNATHVSTTDPEASLSGKNGEYKSLRYKTHNIADADSRVILDCHVTSGAVAEVTVFPDRMEVLRSELGICPQEVTADRGYGSGRNLQYLKNESIESNIPLWSTRVGTAFGKESGFAYDKAKQTMICPIGHRMKFMKPDGDAFLFTLSKKVCADCPLASTCLRETERERGKRIRVHQHQDIYDEVLEKEKNPAFKSKLRERMWKMEGLFAEGKNWHGLRRARYRGRRNLQIQVYMVSTVQNLKRLAAAGYFGASSILREFIFRSMNPRFFAQILIFE